MALPSIKNSVGMAVTAVADSGVGTLTVGAALSGGYQTAATAYAADANIDIRIEEGDTWEVCRDCTYTHSGTTVNRGTLEDGSSGTSTRVAFTTAAKVYVVEPAARIERAIKNVYSITPGGRLTGVAGAPVANTNITTTIYYTPYEHNVVLLWDGANWIPTIFTEKSLALGTLTSGKCYDVFGYLAAGELALEFGTEWTSDTVRATGAGGVSLQDGRYCKGASGSEDKTRLYLGTIFTHTATTTVDNSNYRYIANHYNTVNRALLIIDGGQNAHQYNSTTARAFNNNTNCRFWFLSTFEQAITVSSGGSVNLSSGQLGAGINSTSSTVPASSFVAGWGGSAPAILGAVVGRNYVSVNQRSYAIVDFAWPQLTGSLQC